MTHAVTDDKAVYQAFIGACLSARLQQGDLEEAISVAQEPGFNWDVCLQVADEELASPLLHDILQGRHIAPDAVEAALQRKRDFMARRNLFLSHQLGRNLSLLQDAGIEAIVLKGAALSETVYQDIALRPMRDLDLLLRRERLPAALALLQAHGYAQKTAMLGEAYPVALAKSGIEPVDLELHWTLFHSLYYQQQVAMDWFWQTAYRTEAAGQSMLILGHEAQILHLCGHLTLHHMHQAQLLWRHDLAELIRQKRDEIRWDLLIDKAQTFQLLLPLQEVLPQLAAEWGTPVPEKALGRLRSLPVAEGEREAFALSVRVKQSEGEGYWLRLKEIRGWRRRLRYVVRWFLPKPGALQARYGAERRYLLPLTYVKHWGEGLRLAVEALLTGAKGKGGAP